MTLPQPESARQQPENAAAFAPQGAAVAVPPPVWVAPAIPVALGKARSPIAVWLLSFVTLGVYALVWYYKINRELRDVHPSIMVHPALAMLSLFVPVVGFVSIYNTGKRIAQAQELVGLQGNCSGLLGLVRLFVFGTLSAYYQGRLNQVWAERS